MSDYKDQIQSRAEEIASEEFDCDFYDLSDELRDSVYSRAMGRAHEDMLSRADMAKKIGRGE